MNNKNNRHPVYDSFFARYHDFSVFGTNKVDNNRKRIETIDKEKRMPVDQYCSQDFAKSSHGWPMSDLALLAKAQTQQEFDLAVSRLRELNIPSQNNEGKTVRQILDDVVPRWVQTPAELQQYAKYYYSSFGKSDPVDSSGSDDKKKSSDDPDGDQVNS